VHSLGTIPSSQNLIPHNLSHPRKCTPFSTQYSFGLSHFPYKASTTSYPERIRALYHLEHKVSQGVTTCTIPTHWEIYSQQFSHPERIIHMPKDLIIYLKPLRICWVTFNFREIYSQQFFHLERILHRPDNLLLQPKPPWIYWVTFSFNFFLPSPTKVQMIEKNKIGE
jgi:hypothetical protein